MLKRTLIKITLLGMLAILPSVGMQAQDWKNILSGVANAIGEKAAEKAADKMLLSLEGNWVYAKPDCKLEGDTFLSKAGGELAAKKMEDKITELMHKIGVDEHSVFTFNSDSTYTIQNSKRTTQGTYSINRETKEITLTSKMKFNFTAKVVKNLVEPNKISFLFKADKLMGLAKTITGSLTRNSTNRTISALNSLLDQYDGMMLGFELEKGTKVSARSASETGETEANASNI